MAEFCLGCWNKIMETDDPPKNFHFSRNLDFCEECEQQKPVIIAVRKRYLLVNHLRDFADRLRLWGKNH